MSEMSLSDQQEQELYQRLSKRMRKGLKQIYKEISTAADADSLIPNHTGELFHEASSQLAEVIESTKTATDSIMDIVELHMDYQAEAGGIIEALRKGEATPEQIDRLAHVNNALSNDLTNIMTTLSFQDLTGQRIKKVVFALDKIESTVVELYVSSGLIMQAREKDPSKGLDTLEQEVQDVMANMKQNKSSELKGPSAGASQANIDDLLAQLGMD